MIKPDRAYLLFGALALVYLTIVLSLAPDSDALERYNLTIAQARTLRLALIIPYVVIWFVAFFGYVKIKNYSKIISGSRDGASLSVVATGLLVLALSMPVSAISDNLLTYVNRNYIEWTQLFVLITSYADIIIGISAMFLLYKGARSLAAYADRQIVQKPSYIVSIGLSVMGTAFIALMINSAAHSSEPYSTHIAHNMPLIMLFATIILPLLFTWYSGLQAAYYVMAFRRYVPGVFYRSALAYLASGIVFVILGRITLRYLSSLSTVFSSWALQYVLIALYGFLLLMAVGFGLIAKGAQKLKKLEEA